MGDKQIGSVEMREKSWESGDEENFGIREMGFPIYGLISHFSRKKNIYVNLASFDL